jgi:hypothetical protein
VTGQLSAIADKGLGVPEGYPPEFPPSTVLSLEEIAAVLYGVASVATCGLAFLRAWNRELENMQLVFRVNAAVAVTVALLTLIVDPLIFFPSVCNELEAEHVAACSAAASNSTCLAVTNPLMGARDTPRCAWDSTSAVCGICVGCGHVACELGGILRLLVPGCVGMLWRVYFLFVLNAYIVRFQANEGQSMIGSAGALTDAERREVLEKRLAHVHNQMPEDPP